MPKDLELQILTACYYAREGIPMKDAFLGEYSKDDAILELAFELYGRDYVENWEPEN